MLNKVILIGRLTQNTEMKKVGESNVTNFTVVTSRTWKDRQGEKQEKSEFHNCVAWGKLAEIIDRYKEKGKLVSVVGYIETRSYEKDGAKHYRTEVRVEDYKMLGGGSNSMSQDQVQNIKDNFKPDAEEVKVEDIPF